MPKRCALGCSNNCNSLHRFPHPERNPECFKAWVLAAGGKLDSQADYELYRKKVICDIHFTDRDRNRNNRLNFVAVPSLHLPGLADEVGTSDKVIKAPEPVSGENTLAILKPTLTESSHNQFPHRERNPEHFKDGALVAGGKLYSQANYEMCQKHVTDMDRNCNNQMNFLTAPSVHLSGRADEVSTSDAVILAHEPVSEESTLAIKKPILRGQSKKVILTPEPVNEESCLASLKPTLKDNCARVTSDHNYYKLEETLNREKNNHQQQEAPSLWLNQLKISRRKIKNLQSSLATTQRKYKALKSRIARAKNVSTDLLLKKLTSKMTAAATIFTKMQYTQTNKKPSGRRFSLEEKVLSLTIYKKSPTSYPLLAKYFTLPSIKLLKRLDQNGSVAEAE